MASGQPSGFASVADPLGTPSTVQGRAARPCPVQRPRDQRPGIGLQAFTVLFTGEETEAQREGRGPGKSKQGRGWHHLELVPQSQPLASLRLPTLGSSTGNTCQQVCNSLALGRKTRLCSHPPSPSPHPHPESRLNSEGFKGQEWEELTQRALTYLLAALRAAFSPASITPGACTPRRKENCFGNQKGEVYIQRSLHKKCLGEENGNPLQHSCLGNPLDRGAGRATVHVVTESDTTELLTHTQN